MISVELPSETVTIESLRESELQEARAIQLAMLASEGLRTPWVTIESDSVVFLSDGLVDAMNGDDEILGIEKIVELLAECREKSPQQILQPLFS